MCTNEREETFLNQIFAIRDFIQTLERIREDLNRGAGAREVALTITKLEEAEMWLTRASAIRFGE